MLSIPPATAVETEPAMIASCAWITDFMPDPQTFETVVHGTDAGIRTHGIVCLSGAVMTVTALLLWRQLGAAEGQTDPLRVIEGMATAVGIIGAGLIFVKGGDVKNLTSAAHIWLTVTIGIACGAGYWPVVTIGGGLALLMLVVFKFLSNRIGPE